MIKLQRIIYDISPQLRKLKFDLIVGGHSGWLLPLNYILSRIFNKNLITIAYGNDFLIRSPLSLKSFFFRTVDKVVVITNEMKNLIKKIHHLKDKQIV